MKRSPKPEWVTPGDLDLLVALHHERNLVRACARLGITRERGLYALRRMERIAEGTVVSTHRGGQGGSTQLTNLGRRLLGAGSGASGRATHVATVLDGEWHALPDPYVSLPGGLDLHVTFAAKEGEQVTVAVDPEAIIVARARYPTSARNTLPVTLESVRTTGDTTQLVGKTGSLQFLVAITPQSVRTLKLRPGLKVWLYLKATAVRRLGGPSRDASES